MTKYIFITGGIVSSLGKGIVASSLGRLLKERGFNITIQKFDPYINRDAGTMNPCQHGEVFVTDDGYEADLDLGHYERFVNISLSKDSNMTTGKIYESVLQKERNGDYLGNTVQVIPHVTNEIKSHIYDKKDFDIVITEIGGTVGDIESLPFLEAIRQVKKETGKDSIYIHVTLLPYIAGAGEVKTKPTQHSVKELRAIGIQPDIIVCRSENPISTEMKEKIALFCDVDKDAIIENCTAKSIYEVPLLLHQNKLDDIVMKKLELSAPESEMKVWRNFVHDIYNPTSKIFIAVVGKYVNLKDAYISITEALKHAGAYYRTDVDISYISSESLEDPSVDLGDILQLYDGILIPGGFGERGIEGKIKALEFGRKHDIPCFGICLGMQCMVIEFARSLGISANSLEFDKDTPNPVITLMESQHNITKKGGTMRLGAYPCRIHSDKIKKFYNADLVYERHRHRYEFNNDYRYTFVVEHGMNIAGVYEEENLVEMIELPELKWYVGCQFHPEFKSRPDNPHPLFLGFVSSCLERRQS